MLVWLSVWSEVQIVCIWPSWCHCIPASHHLLQPFNGLFSRTSRVSRYQKGETNLDFTEARDSEWQWHQLGHMQVCTSLQTDNHASTPPLCFLQAGCPSCRPTNSVKALKAYITHHLLPHLNPDWICLSGTGLPRLSWKRGHWMGVVVAVVVVVLAVVVVVAVAVV